ncbi:MAG: hypothetical protein WA865_10395 [Spirulinaceae cyanobacterium]
MISFKQILASTSLVTGAIISVSTGSAQAFSFQTGEDLGACDPLRQQVMTKNAPSPNLTTCETTDGFRLTAGFEGNPGNETKSPLLAAKKVKNTIGLGVNFDKDLNSRDPGDYGTDGEIDAGEYITLEALKGPSIFDHIELSFLYQPGVHNDAVYEIALLETSQGKTGTLRITGNSTAEYLFNGKTTIINALSPSTHAGGGYYRINNPFGDIKVGQVKLSAPGKASDNSTQHDYSLVAAKATQVPEPGSAAAVLGLGLLVARCSRRKESANNS